MAKPRFTRPNLSVSMWGLKIEADPLGRLDKCPILKEKKLPFVGWLVSLKDPALSKIFSRPGCPKGDRNPSRLPATLSLLPSSLQASTQLSHHFISHPSERDSTVRAFVLSLLVETRNPCASYHFHEGQSLREDLRFRQTRQLDGITRDINLPLQVHHVLRRRLRRRTRRQWRIRRPWRLF